MRTLPLLLAWAPVAALCIVRSNGSAIPVAARGQASLTPAGTGRVGVRTALARGEAVAVRARERVGSCRRVLKNPILGKQKKRGLREGSGFWVYGFGFGLAFTVCSAAPFVPVKL